MIDLLNETDRQDAEHHPMTGVRASMMPNTAPARIALATEGRRDAPRPTAATKASVDILIENDATATGVMINAAGQQDAHSSRSARRGMRWSR